MVELRVLFSVQILERNTNSTLKLLFLLITLVVDILSSLNILLQLVSFLFLDCMHIFHGVLSEGCHKVVACLSSKLVFLDLPLVRNGVDKTLSVSDSRSLANFSMVSPY